MSNVSSYKELARKSFVKKTVKLRGSSSVPGAVLHTKNDLAAQRKQIAMSASQQVYFSLRDVLERTEQFFGALYGVSSQKRCKRE